MSEIGDKVKKERSELDLETLRRLLTETVRIERYDSSGKAYFNHFASGLSVIVETNALFSLFFFGITYDYFQYSDSPARTRCLPAAAGAPSRPPAVWQGAARWTA